MRPRELLALRPGEGPRLALLLAHSLAAGLYSSFYLSTALALFLDRFGVGLLPYVYVASAVVGFAAVHLFSALGRRLPYAALLAAVPLSLAAMTLALWHAARGGGSPWWVFLMTVLIAPGFTLLDLELWGLAGRLFDLRQGKRLFALVGTGEVAAGMLGFFLVPLLVPLLGGPLHLLPAASASLLVAAAVVMAARRLHGPALAAGGARHARARLGLGTLLRDRYFAAIALLALLFVASLYAVDFLFLSQVPRYFGGSAQVAGFLGVFFGVYKAGELGMRGFLAARLIGRFGLRLGLAALPATLLPCALLAAAAGLAWGPGSMPFFVLVALGKLVWMVLWKSLYDPSYRVLYLPLPPERQLAFQGGVEGTVRQAAVLAAGGGLVFLSARDDGLLLVCLLLPLLAAWIAVAGRLHREYRRLLLDGIAAQETAAGGAEPAAPGRRAPAGEAPAVKRLAEELVEQAAWDLAALLDLESEPAAAGVSIALRDEVEQARERLVLALSALHDPRAIRLAAEGLARGGEAAVYALEILDLVVSPDLRPLVVPLFEELPPAQRLKRLEAFAPQPRLAVAERLTALVCRDAGRIGARTRARALEALGELAAASGAALPGALLASLFHPDPLLQEAAARSCVRVDPLAFQSYLAKLPHDLREKLDRMAGEI